MRQSPFANDGIALQDPTASPQQVKAMSDSSQSTQLKTSFLQKIFSEATCNFLKPRLITQVGITLSFHEILLAGHYEFLL